MRKVTIVFRDGVEGKPIRREIDRPSSDFKETILRRIPLESRKLSLTYGNRIRLSHVEDDNNNRIVLWEREK